MAVSARLCPGPEISGFRERLGQRPPAHEPGVFPAAAIETDHGTGVSGYLGSRRARKIRLVVTRFGAWRVGGWSWVGIAASLACSSSDVSPSDVPGGSGGSGAGTPLPCIIEEILESQCSECHGAEPGFGAPMSLVSWEDVHRPSKSDPSQPVYQRIGARIHDEMDVMPPPPRSLTSQQKNLLDTWVRAGAPKRTGDCGAGGAGGSAGAGVGGVGGGAGTGGTGGSAGNAGTGGSAGGPVADCTPVSFVAHGAQAPNDPTPFNTAPGGEHYQCFNFKAPWNEPVHGIEFNAIIDNSKVVHHWLLYSTATPLADGTSAPCAGVHPDAVLVAGWAPGATDVKMPPGVGAELPWGPQGHLILEVHYNNATGSVEADRSGVEVCATTELQPETATVSWLGTELIAIAPNSPGVASSTCTPNHPGPITILRSWPHMHQLGRSFRTEILRADGSTEMLIDVPSFDFDYQIGYDTPAVIHPGDRLVTTCEYQNPNPVTVTFGPRTADEMCYNFVTAYPAGALTSLGLMARSCGI